MSEPPKKKLCSDNGGKPALTLGAPRPHAGSGRYATKGGVTVDCLVEALPDPNQALEELIDQLDQERGCVFQSSYEFPGRYARWTMGFVNPPLAFEGWGRRFLISALNPRGQVLLPAIRDALQGLPALASLVAELWPVARRAAMWESAASTRHEARSERPTTSLVGRWDG